MAAAALDERHGEERPRRGPVASSSSPPSRSPCSRTGARRRTAPPSAPSPAGIGSRLTASLADRHSRSRSSRSSGESMNTATGVGPERDLGNLQGAADGGLDLDHRRLRPAPLPLRRVRLRARGAGRQQPQLARPLRDVAQAPLHRRDLRAAPRRQLGGEHRVVEHREERQEGGVDDDAAGAPTARRPARPTRGARARPRARRARARPPGRGRRRGTPSRGRRTAGTATPPRPRRRCARRRTRRRRAATRARAARARWPARPRRRAARAGRRCPRAPRRARGAPPPGPSRARGRRRRRGRRASPPRPPRRAAGSARRSRGHAGAQSARPLRSRRGGPRRARTSSGRGRWSARRPCTSATQPTRARSWHRERGRHGVPPSPPSR